MKKPTKKEKAEVVALQDWLRDSRIGDVYTYAFSTEKRNEEVFKLAGRLADAGMAFPFQQRIPSGHSFNLQRISALAARFIQWAGDLVEVPSR